MISFIAISHGLACAWLWAGFPANLEREQKPQADLWSWVHESYLEVRDTVAEYADELTGMIELVGVRRGRVCRVTAYCDRGITASGVRVGAGQCAAPADIPFGSKVYIPELRRTFVVTDRTAKRFRHNTVDIYMPKRRDCKQFGRRYLHCEFVVYTQAEAKETLCELKRNVGLRN